MVQLNPLLLLGIFLMFFSTPLLLIGLSALKMSKIIRELPISKIRSISMGLVKIKGKVLSRKNSILKTPFSNKKCVFTKYRVYLYHKDLIIKTCYGTLKERFYLKDKTGSVLIDPNKAQIKSAGGNMLITNWQHVIKDPKTLPNHIKTFLKEKKFKYEFFLSKTGGRLHFIEYNILQNNPATIIGTAGDNPEIEEGTTQQGHKDIMISKNHKHLIISSQKNSNPLTNDASLSKDSLVIGTIIGFLGLIITIINLIFF